MKLAEVHAAVLRHLRESRHAGWDPFDALNSDVFLRTGLGRFPFARLAFLQALKRSPVNVRRLLGVPRERNPKGVALTVLGLLEDHQRLGQPALLDEAVSLGRWLLGAAVDPSEWGGVAWGYNFAWQARAFYVPRGTPNVIATVYAARALDALASATSDSRFASAANSAAEFIATRMVREAEGQSYIVYVPGTDALVYNANLWGAAWCARIGRRSGNPTLLDLARRALTVVVAAQHADGSWPYGNRGHHRFVDGFHTGFVLEALDWLREDLDEPALAEVVRRGFAFYRAALIEPDGTARYYTHERYPLDVHSAAQFVVTLSRLRMPGFREMQSMVMLRAVEQLFDCREGCFNYQRWRFYTNRIKYTRWTQAWAYFALAVLLRDEARGTACVQ